MQKSAQYLHVFVVVYPNGDSAKFGVICAGGICGSVSIEYVEGSATDSEGNPLQDGSENSANEGSEDPNIELGQFVIKVIGGGFDGSDQWFFCGPDGNGGTECYEIPEPEQP